jgi:hypothetical protein
VAGFLGETLSLFSVPMEVLTAPNAARGEVTLPLAGGPVTVRFGMAVMRAVTKQSGKTLAEFMAYLGEDYLAAVPLLVAAAVNLYAPGVCAAQSTPFDEDAAALLIDSLSEAQGQALGNAIAEALAVTAGPLMGALLAKVAEKAPSQTLAASPETGSSN